MPDHPDAPEERTVDVDVQDLDTRGRTVHGFAAVYGSRSADLGGFTEVIAPGAFAAVVDGCDARALLNHDANQVLGRTRSGTLRLFDESRGLRFELDLPNSPLGENVREAVSRGDIDGASFRMRVSRDSWEGDVRTVEEISELSDCTLATYPAYPETSVELRTRPEKKTTTEEENTMQTEDRSGGGLAVEDRAATDQPDIEARVLNAIHNVSKGESRDLTNVTAEPISPPEMSTFLFDRLRPMSIGLASGMVVIPTDRQKVTWPQIVSDVDPTWVAELEVIPDGEPGFGTLEAEPKKLAHLVSPISNEVIDDSEPSAVEVLNAHLIAMMALKLDRSLFEGLASDPKSITGLKYQSGIQTLTAGGANGAALTNYDLFVKAVGMLRDSNVPGPYAIAAHGSVLTQLELLKDEAGSSKQLMAPANLPPMFTSSQLSITETKGTSSNARSAYVYAPSQVVLIRRKDSMVELDRSRLFQIDASEMRGVARADLLLPNPQAVVRIDGIIPAA